ncbi:DUF5753 domain-containing protein [Streptomyces mirabilis]|uniref:DUF5753 domain-containing protein n=1 Tax=Streptomyces mirabilis TaxID=68239 RepID=UPI003D9EBED6
MRNRREHRERHVLRGLLLVGDHRHVVRAENHRPHDERGPAGQTEPDRLRGPPRGGAALGHDDQYRFTAVLLVEVREVVRPTPSLPLVLLALRLQLFLDIAELEHHAAYRLDVEFLHVPGLFQTEDYARAIFSYRVPELPDNDLELRVRHRMERKAIIRDPAPVPYEAVIHEAALRIRADDRAAMRTQLTRIVELSEADHITVRVIPFDLDGFAGATNAMMYAGGAVPQLDTVVRDAPHGAGFIDSEAQLGAFRTLFRKVEAASLEPARSRDFIHRLAKEL